MRPFIKNNDLLQIEEINCRALKRGNIVLCRLSNSRYVIHRIIKTTPNELLIQGDSLILPDGWIPYSNVLGRVVLIKRNRRIIHLTGFWMEGIIHVWLIIRPALALIYRLLKQLHYLLHHLSGFLAKRVKYNTPGTNPRRPNAKTDQTAYFNNRGSHCD